MRALDALGTASAEQARSALAACRAVPDDFARRVDQAETASLTGLPVSRPPSVTLNFGPVAAEVSLRAGLGVGDNDVLAMRLALTAWWFYADGLYPLSVTSG